MVQPPWCLLYLKNVRCFLCQDPGDETHPDQPTPSVLLEENNAGEVLEAHPHMEDSGEAAQPEEQTREVQEVQEVQVRQRHAENEVSEVDIPNVGRITVRADADGYNEEVDGGPPGGGAWSPLISAVVPLTDDADSSHAGRHSGHRQGQTDV